MKLKTKKVRFVVYHQQNSQAKLPEKVLHEYSDNYQHQIFSKSFAYTHLRHFEREASSLSTWGENKPTIDPPSVLTKKSIKIVLQHQKQISDKPIVKNNNQENTLLQLQSESRRNMIPLRQKSLRANTTRTRCIINVVSPKFDDQKIQLNFQRPLNQNNSPLIFSSQGKDKLKERKPQIIKRVRRQHAHTTISQNQSRYDDLQRIAINEEKQVPDHYQKICKDIQLKFSQRSAQEPRSIRRIMKEDNSQRVSRLLAYKNSRCSRGKSFMKRDKSIDLTSRRSSQFNSLEEFTALKTILNRQNIDKIQSRRISTHH